MGGPVTSRVVVLGTLVLMFAAPVVAAVPLELPSAGPTASADDAAAPSRWTFAPQGLPFQHPLWNVPLSVWMPTLIATQDWSEAAEAADEWSQTTRDLLPLGDANGDGKADYIVSTTTITESTDEMECYEELGGEHCYESWDYQRETVLGATAGGSYQSLWTLEIPDETYWYPAGDVDRDGVPDLMLESETNDGTEGVGLPVPYVGAWRYEETGMSHYRLVSGATGADLLKMDVPYRYSVTEAGAGFLAGAYAWDYELDIGHLAPVREGPAGVDVFRLTIHDTTAYASAVVVYDRVSINSVVSSVERYDLAGKAKWTASASDPVAMLTVVDNRDMNGDGVSDVLFGPVEETVVSANVEGATPPVSKPVVVLIDGKTGAEAWRYEDDPFLGITMATGIGRLQGKTFDVGLYLVEVGPQGDMTREELRFLDGGSGAEIGSATSTTDLFFASPFADATGDGKDEVLLIRMPKYDDSLVNTVETEEDSVAFGVATKDLEYLWSINEGDDDYWYYEDLYYFGTFGGGMYEPPDFDGDDVPDFLRYDWRSEFRFGRGGNDKPTVRALSGATGAELWSVEREAGTFEFQPVGDVDGDGGDDLAAVRFDLPNDGEMDEFNHYPGHLDLLRGRDAEQFWTKLIFHPDAFPDAAGEWLSVMAVGGGDVDGNGVDDVLLSLNAESDSYCCGVVIFVDECCEERDAGRDRLGLTARVPQNESEPDDEDDEDAPPFQLALVVEGATGDTLMMYPETPFFREQVVEAGPASIAVEPEPEPKENGMLPGFDAALIAAAAVAVSLVLRRRRA